MSVGGLNTKKKLTNALEVAIELARRADLCACAPCTFLRAIGEAADENREVERRADAERTANRVVVESAPVRGADPACPECLGNGYKPYTRPAIGDLPAISGLRIPCGCGGSK